VLVEWGKMLPMHMAAHCGNLPAYWCRISLAFVFFGTFGIGGSACHRSGLSARHDAAPFLENDASVDTSPVLADAAPEVGDVLSALRDSASNSPLEVPDSASDQAASDSTANQAADAPIAVDRVVDGAPIVDATSVADAETDAGPITLPSRQSVTFRFGTARAGWVVTQGWLCAPMAIERQIAPDQWESVTLGLPFQCGCECPSPGQVGPRELKSITRPKMLEVVWDAREQVVVETTVDCLMSPAPHYTVKVQSAVAQPVSAGHYRVSIPFDTTLPTVCQETGTTGTATCTHPLMGMPPSTYSLCAGDLAAKGEFDLPESGDIVVTLSVI
jgi:hypothetical protein